MRKYGGFLAAFAVAVLLAAAVTPSDAATRKHVRAAVGRSTGYDGMWSVSISTSYGQCGSYRAAVRIAGGNVGAAGGDFSLSGHVNANGGTYVTVSSSMGSASGSGRLHGSTGGGRWRSSGGECAGSWYASRRGGGGY
jgi:hypothetical protein